MSNSEAYTEDTLKSEHRAMFLQNNEATRPHSRGRGHSIHEAEAKAGCNEAKAKVEAVIFEAEAISRT